MGARDEVAAKLPHARLRHHMKQPVRSASSDDSLCTTETGADFSEVSYRAVQPPPDSPLAASKSAAATPKEPSSTRPPSPGHEELISQISRRSSRRSAPSSKCGSSRPSSLISQYSVEEITFASQQSPQADSDLVASNHGLTATAVAEPQTLPPETQPVVDATQIAAAAGAGEILDRDTTGSERDDDAPPPSLADRMAEARAAAEAADAVPAIEVIDAGLQEVGSESQRSMSEQGVSESSKGEYAASGNAAIEGEEEDSSDNESTAAVVAAPISSARPTNTAQSVESAAAQPTEQGGEEGARSREGAGDETPISPVLPLLPSLAPAPPSPRRIADAAGHTRSVGDLSPRRVGETVAAAEDEAGAVDVEAVKQKVLESLVKESQKERANAAAPEAVVADREVTPAPLSRSASAVARMFNHHSHLAVTVLEVKDIRKNPAVKHARALHTPKIYARVGSSAAVVSSGHRNVEMRDGAPAYVMELDCRHVVPLPEELEKFECELCLTDGLYQVAAGSFDLESSSLWECEVLLTGTALAWVRVQCEWTDSEPISTSRTLIPAPSARAVSPFLSEQVIAPMDDDGGERSCLAQAICESFLIRPVRTQPVVQHAPSAPYLVLTYGTTLVRSRTAVVDDAENIAYFQDDFKLPYRKFKYVELTLRCEREFGEDLVLLTGRMDLDVALMSRQRRMSVAMYDKQGARVGSTLFYVEPLSEVVPKPLALPSPEPLAPQNRYASLRLFVKFADELSLPTKFAGGGAADRRAMQPFVAISYGSHFICADYHGHGKSPIFLETFKLPLDSDSRTLRVTLYDKIGTPAASPSSSLEELARSKRRVSWSQLELAGRSPRLSSPRLSSTAGAAVVIGEGTLQLPKLDIRNEVAQHLVPLFYENEYTGNLFVELSLGHESLRAPEYEPAADAAVMRSDPLDYCYFDQLPVYSSFLVRVVAARGLRRVSADGRKSVPLDAGARPYIALTNGAMGAVTTSCAESPADPVFLETFHFPVRRQRFMRCSVFDEAGHGAAGGKRLVGSGKLDLEEVACERRRVLRVKVPLVDGSGNSVGHLFCELQGCTGDVGSPVRLENPELKLLATAPASASPTPLSSSIVPAAELSPGLSPVSGYAEMVRSGALSPLAVSGLMSPRAALAAAVAPKSPAAGAFEMLHLQPSKQAPQSQCMALDLEVVRITGLSSVLEEDQCRLLAALGPESVPGIQVRQPSHEQHTSHHELPHDLFAFPYLPYAYIKINVTSVDMDTVYATAKVHLDSFLNKEGAKSGGGVHKLKLPLLDGAGQPLPGGGGAMYIRLQLFNNARYARPSATVMKPKARSQEASRP